MITYLLYTLFTETVFVHRDTFCKLGYDVFFYNCVIVMCMFKDAMPVSFDQILTFDHTHAVKSTSVDLRNCQI